MAAGGDHSYKSSDEVRAYYRQQMEANNYDAANETDSSLPLGWDQREKAKEVEAKQYGVFAVSSSVTVQAATTPSSSTTTATVAEVALLQVTTNSLEALASVLENSKGRVSIPNEERTKFAMALKHAMDAMANCK